MKTKQIKFTAGFYEEPSVCLLDSFCGNEILCTSSDGTLNDVGVEEYGEL